jgi:hypothetical protein
MGTSETVGFKRIWGGPREVIRPCSSSHSAHRPCKVAFGSGVVRAEWLRSRF